MLTSLRLKNFRGFDNHLVPLRPATLIVGRNNAGKSSLVEALRLLSLVTKRFRALGYHEGPVWGGIPRREYGVRPSLKSTEINFTTLFYRYSDPPAVIEATFANQTSIRIYIGGEDRIHAVIFDSQRHPVRTKAAALRLELPTVEILPQVGPLDVNEVILNEDYVRRVASSSLASRHFRNQLRVFSDKFAEFKEMVEETWSGLRVLDLRSGQGFPGEPLSLMLRDEGFAVEVSAMGHGLQMWLQTMWFLARARDEECVILDEPDVYMHPDLQRKLIRYLKLRRQQVLIATHSVEMMSEMEPEDILVVDRRRSSSRFATGAPAVQRLVEHVGSVHNIQLAKLWNARKCLLVEGKDVKLLSIVHRILFPESEPLEMFPHIPVGGWGGWTYAIGSSMLLKNSGGETITVYCIMDSDYHSQASIIKRHQEAERNSIKLHIWSRKEIENYFLCAATIVRVIEWRMPARMHAPPVREVASQLDEICESLKDETFDGISAELLAENRSLGAGGANRQARQILTERWRTREERLDTVSGKQAFSMLSEWTQDQFGVSLNPATVAREMQLSEVPVEMVRILSAVEKGEEF